mgnify:FL=1
MDIRAFITHKEAETFSDCQDRFSINSDTKSVAVSDGMSQSFFQKIWAENLVDAFVNNPRWNLYGEQCNEFLKEQQGKWLEKVLDRIEEQKHDGTKENIIYRNEKFVAQGKSAGATLLGVRFVGANWHCQVLGDSCLIEIKDGEIVQICTSQEGDEFDNFPDHFDSNPKLSGKGNAKEFKGTLETDSVLLLVSDPFSDFLNEQRKKGSVKELVDALLNIGTHEEFEKLVSDWRTIKGMHNDDSTLVVIRYDGNTEFNVGYEDSLKNLGQDDSKKTLMPVMKTNESEIDEEFIKDFMGSFEKNLRKKPGFRNLTWKVAYKFVQKTLRETLESHCKKYKLFKR